MSSEEWETAGGRLSAVRGTRRRVLAGETMVTPNETLMIDGMIAVAGKEHFHRDHPAVAARPERFRAADKKDTETASRLRSMVTRSRRHAGRVAVRGRALPGRRRGGESWRLR